MSDPPNPYRRRYERPENPTSPQSPVVAPPTVHASLPSTNVQEQTTTSLIETARGPVTTGAATTRITIDNTTGDRTVDTRTRRAASLDGNVLDERSAVACPRCKRAPYTTAGITACTTCGRRACKKHCLKKTPDWTCNACRRRAALRKALTWLATR